MSRINYTLAFLLGVILLWHSLYTIIEFDPQFLFFTCYPATLLVIAGLLWSFPMCLGIGGFWLISALPLYLHYAIVFSDWEISGILFHICGPLVAIFALRHYKLSRFTWLFAMAFGMIFQVLARIFTASDLNVNAAFRVYQGWEGLFPDYKWYLLFSYTAFSLTFLIKKHSSKLRKRQKIINTF